MPVVGPEAQAVLDPYLPRLADHRHARVIRRIAAAAGPTGPRVAGFMAGAAADLVAWADRPGHPTGLHDFLRRAVVDDPTADSTSSTAVTCIARAAPRTSGVPVLTGLRCPLTWLTAHLASGTRPDTLMHAAGLTGTSNLDRYAEMLPPMPADQARRSLRGTDLERPRVGEQQDADVYGGLTPGTCRYRQRR